MRYPSLARLRTFATVAETGSFRKAATQLHLSQPALSAHIRDLEQTLGVPLFNRTTRAMQLTPDGERFLARTRRALDEIESGLLDVREQVKLQRGRVTIACVPIVASYVIPKALALFSKRHPLVEVQIWDVVSKVLVRQVIDREADFGVGPRPDPDDDIEFVPFIRDPFIALFPEGHALASAPAVRLRQLIDFPLLTLRAGTTVRENLNQAFEQNGLTLKPAYELSQQYTIGGLVAAGLGVALLPSMSLSMLDTPRLRVVPIVAPKISRDVGFIQRRDQPHRPSVRAFLKALSDCFHHPMPESPRVRRRK